MRYGILILILLIQTCDIFSQKDTILYFSKLGRLQEKSESASYYISIKKLNENSYVQTKKFVDENIKSQDQLKITKVNDSTYSYTSNDSKYSHLRRCSKVDTGYIIRDNGFKGMEVGYSKLIFPLIKSGVWYTYKDSPHIKLAEEYYNNNEMMGNKNWNEDGSDFMSDVFLLTETPIGYNNGSIDKVSRIIAKNLIYPKEAQEHQIQGRVIVQFVVMENGTVDGIRILRGAHPLLDNEAIRAIKAIPSKWTPGTIRGKAVRAFAVLPLNFNVN